MRSRRRDGSQQDEVHIRVKGQSSGSIEFFTKDGILAEALLPGQQFQIFKALAEQARLAVPGSGSTAFVASDVLARRLYNANRASDYGSQVATKAVHRLRHNAELKRALAAAFDLRDDRGRPVAADLIESRRHFGYRLALIPPERIHFPGEDALPPAGQTPPAPHFQSTAPVQKGC